MTWRDEIRVCGVCSTQFQPKREGQSYCSTRCRNNAAQKKHRHREAMTCDDRTTPRTIP